MTEAGDYDPGPWKGYDFKSARAAYDAHVGRSYDDAVKTKKSLKDLVVNSLSTNCKSPLVIACDVTGSMGEWPATIFEKLPLLDLELKNYLDDPEVSFAAIGDAYSDDYPLQVQKFSSGKDLVARLKALIIEGRGGSQTRESYDLAALYYANNVEMPKATKPIFIFIGDEGLYETVDKDQAKDIAHVALEKRLSSKQAIEALKQKYSVYIIRKLYDGYDNDRMSATDERIQKQWESYLGADHVAILPEAKRVVDDILGIIAKETSMLDYFDKELTERQTPLQVKTVKKSLMTIHGPRALPDPGKSVMKRDKTMAKTKSLLGDKDE
ncbi:hypothetical protein HYX19_01535 [Candidatus Woesearchaeota archaeon]|nr:hypothetical protein [Candidatus Woesearchaeota archaeon]